jgi:hypothetical protein
LYPRAGRGSNEFHAQDQAIFDVAEGIVRKIADALPHHASRVGQVIVSITVPLKPDRRKDAQEPESHVRRIVRLH